MLLRVIAVAFDLQQACVARACRSLAKRSPWRFRAAF